MQWRGHTYEMWETSMGWYYMIAAELEERGPFATEQAASDAIEKWIDKDTSCSGRV